MMRPRSTRTRRVTRSRVERRIIRVYSEGSVTEPEYLKYWERRSSAVSLDWGESGMSPMGLVGRARADISRNRRIARRQGSLDFDEIWCVFDVDSHPSVSQAIFEAMQSGINVAVSNPCFELWLVLHCEDCQAHTDRGEIQRRARRSSLIDGKSIPEAAQRTLEERYEDARRRAKELDRMHERNGSPMRSNPSTDLWRLVDRIRS